MDIQRLFDLLNNSTNPIEICCIGLFGFVVAVLYLIGKLPNYSYELANISFFFFLIPALAFDLKKRYVVLLCLISYPVALYFREESYLLFRWCCDLIIGMSNQSLMNYIYLCDIICLFIPFLIWLLVKTLKINTPIWNSLKTNGSLYKKGYRRTVSRAKLV